MSQMSTDISWNDMRERQLKAQMDALQNDTLAMRLARFDDEEFERSERFRQEAKKRGLKKRKFNNE